MSSLRSLLSTSASFALMALAAAACGSPVVGLECRDGFERCGLACYDLTSDNAHCGSCGISCGEGSQCVDSQCMEGFYLPNDGGFVHTGDGGPGLDGGRGDGGVDMDAHLNIPDGSMILEDGRNILPDGGPYVEPPHPPDGSVTQDDGAIIQPDGAIYCPPSICPDGTHLLPDGAVVDADGGLHMFPIDIPDGAVIEPDGAIILPDGGFFNPDGAVPPPVPPPLCMGVPTNPHCVCDLGQTECNLVCVNLLTDNNNCQACNTVCPAGTFCNGTSGCQNVCTAPLTYCNGQCVDFSNDDANCGGCGLACTAAAACLPTGDLPPLPTGSCVGEAVGHIVVVGHDMSLVSRPIRQLVGNAVFLAPRNPVRVLAYDATTSVASRVGVSAAITQSSAAIGRAYTLTTADPASVTQQLGDADVLVIEPQQGATDLELQTLGANWSAALDTFLFRGGVILLFEGGSGNNGTYQILNTATSQVSVTDPTVHPLFEAAVVQPLSQRVLTLENAADAIGAGVPTEYQSQGETVGFIGTNPRSVGTVKIVIEDVMTTAPGAPAPTNLPVVIHGTTR